MQVNPFQPIVVFHIETCHLISTANQMTGFYMTCNAGLGWVSFKANVYTGEAKQPIFIRKVPRKKEITIKFFFFTHPPSTQKGSCEKSATLITSFIVSL